MVRSGVFDLDGTLASTANVHLMSWLMALRELGIKAVSIDVRTLLGKRAADIARTILSSVSDGHSVTPEALVEVKNRYFKTMVNDGVKPMPCAVEITRAIKRSGGKVLVVTSSLRYSAELILRAINIEPDVLVAGDDVTEGKPSPTPVLKALAQVNLRPCEVFGVGDTIVDLEAYWRSGIRDIYLVKGDVEITYSDSDIMRFNAKRVNTLCDVMRLESLLI